MIHMIADMSKKLELMISLTNNFKNIGCVLRNTINHGYENNRQW